MSTQPGGIGWTTLLALLFVAAAGAEAQLTPTLLPPLAGDINSSARGINPPGEVVGSSSGFFSFNTAVLWDRDGNPTLLPPLPGDFSSDATGINPRGDVVGTSFGNIFRPITAVLWDRDGNSTPLLPLPGDRNSEAHGINPRGDVVGVSIRFVGRRTAVVWRGP